MINNFLLNHAVYEIVWKNFVEPSRPQMTIRRMRIAYWVRKATNTLSEYVIAIDFPATMVPRTSLIFTVYAHGLSFQFLLSLLRLT